MNPLATRNVFHRLSMMTEFMMKHVVQEDLCDPWLIQARADVDAGWCPAAIAAETHVAQTSPGWLPCPSDLRHGHVREPRLVDVCGMGHEVDRRPKAGNRRQEVLVGLDGA